MPDCDLDYDPFLWMQEHGKRYGFNIILREIRETIPSLYEHTLKYAEAANLSTRLLRFFGEPTEGWKGYNLCHFWSNFEIADMNLWRNPVYQKYFDYLDSTGNFYYERWGDVSIMGYTYLLLSIVFVLDQWKKWEVGGG